jgi:hypothetical protein
MVNGVVEYWSEYQYSSTPISITLMISGLDRLNVFRSSLFILGRIVFER